MVRFQRVKLIAGLLYSDPEIFMEARRALSRLFGKIDFESGEMDFTHTDYYEEEMGASLNRKFLSFDRLLGPESIYRVKIGTNALERRFSRHGRRRVNIDPGYLDLSKVVLFSTKDYSHRIHLAKGIFAEVTLFYKNKRYNAWPWTYPDYASEGYINIFNAIRDIYKTQR